MVKFRFSSPYSLLHTGLMFFARKSHLGEFEEIEGVRLAEDCDNGLIWFIDFNLARYAAALEDGPGASRIEASAIILQEVNTDAVAILRRH